MHAQLHALQRGFGLGSVSPLAGALAAFDQLESVHQLAGQQPALRLGADSLTPVLDQPDELHLAGQISRAGQVVRFLRRREIIEQRAGGFFNLGSQRRARSFGGAPAAAFFAGQQQGLFIAATTRRCRNRRLPKIEAERAIHSRHR